MRRASVDDALGIHMYVRARCKLKCAWNYLTRGSASMSARHRRAMRTWGQPRERAHLIHTSTHSQRAIAPTNAHQSHAYMLCIVWRTASRDEKPIYVRARGAYDVKALYTLRMDFSRLKYMLLVCVCAVRTSLHTLSLGMWECVRDGCAVCVCVMSVAYRYIYNYTRDNRTDARRAPARFVSQHREL